MAVADEQMILTTRDYFVTENVLNPAATPEEIAAFVKRYKSTGILTYTTQGGGTRAVTLTERTRANLPQGNEIRKVMGMDYITEE